MKSKGLTLLTALVAVSAAGLSGYWYAAEQSYAATPIADSNQTQTHEVLDMRPWSERARDFVKPDDSMLKKQLSPLQYKVTQHDGTERPFKNEYWDNKQSGIYVDVISGEPLFSSLDKYKSGTGWPSFTRPIEGGALTLHEDRKLFSVRTELRGRLADSHLGHVFDDGPRPTGQRYCINSAALRFIPKQELEKEGYGEFLALFESGEGAEKTPSET